MIRTHYYIIVLAAVLMISGCKKDEATTPTENQFTNGLTLGTGMNASTFQVTGETTTFTRVGGTVMVYWRLESATDMAGSQVKIRLDKQTSGVYAPFDSATYNNPQSTGHIMLSSLSVTSIGTYRATGVLITGTKVVASKDFTVQ
ncbi:MAG: hypothetical protein HY961_00275 [Ignavibacteriae bacterium]|nr:hypothetical protein [Ignavibacteriota bacterium]